MNMEEAVQTFRLGFKAFEGEFADEMIVKGLEALELAGVLELDDCWCNVGTLECPRHETKTKSKEEKIAFRKDWDERVRDA